jgi:uncharacterized protein DUF4255
MPKHQVIRDVGQSLLGVIRAELSQARVKAKAYLATPTPEFLRKNAPCLVLYLYDLRPGIFIRQGEEWALEEEITNDKGETYVVKYPRPLELGLKYLLTAYSEDLADEHEFLALGLRALHEKPELNGDSLVGDSFFRGDTLKIRPDDRFTLETASTVFGGFGTGPRLAVGYQADARLYSMKEMSRSKRVRQRHIDVFDQLRPPPGSVSAKELGLEAKPPKIVSNKK